MTPLYISAMHFILVTNWLGNQVFMMLSKVERRKSYDFSGCDYFDGNKLNCRTKIELLCTYVDPFYIILEQLQVLQYPLAY